MKVKITLTEEMLGTKSSNKDLFDQWQASKAPTVEAQKQELANADAVELPPPPQKPTSTIFHRENGQIGIYDFQIKGFFKEACGALNRFDPEYRGGLAKLSAYKTKINTCLFVFPRFIPATLPAGMEPGKCDRPLKADTPQGTIVTLVRSETLPIGTTLEFEVKVFIKDLEPYIIEWLKYGFFNGLGQWRSGSKGRYTCEIL
jgi:hypothetical protein